MPNISIYVTNEDFRYFIDLDSEEQKNRREKAAKILVKKEAAQ